ncbi:3-hexulose-6-phosphate isomerase [Tetragenococcus halophilus subsp. flandriensis]|uniref:6-phospho-3-hexuloisomerase n=1 Tax=Tetragenococcus halophilus TaxID=51669 RepID=UPI0023EA47CE|nr:6-phospho-3-hexuloisomerase [Tetragenococcus halophilus]GMA08820.1 3-hexulose-6-phosphate isomerase [Tetragenococcus halophilus subsp. flandriensis]
MTECKTLLEIIEELSEDAEKVDNSQLEIVEQLITKAKRVFITGAGRSGFAARAFANRLMHLGIDSHFVGEPTTPSIRRGDLLIIGSGSGKTESLVTMAKKAKKEDAELATITINPNNEIGSIADAYIKIPGISSRDTATEKASSIQPNGSSFEQLSWLIYDSIIVDLIRITQQTQEEIDFRHANME